MKNKKLCLSKEKYANNQDDHLIIDKGQIKNYCRNYECCDTVWFSDCYANSCYRGIVASIPHGKFLIGYIDEDAGIMCIERKVYTGDMEELKYDADYFTEKSAEKNREEYEIMSAATVYYDLKNELSDLLKGEKPKSKIDNITDKIKNIECIYNIKLLEKYAPA